MTQAVRSVPSDQSDGSTILTPSRQAAKGAGGAYRGDNIQFPLAKYAKTAKKLETLWVPLGDLSVLGEKFF